MIAPSLVGVEVPAGQHVIVFHYKSYSHYPILVTIGIPRSSASHLAAAQAASAPVRGVGGRRGPADADPPAEPETPVPDLIGGPVPERSDPASRRGRPADRGGNDRAGRGVYRVHVRQYRFPSRRLLRRCRLQRRRHVGVLPRLRERRGRGEGDLRDVPGCRAVPRIRDPDPPARRCVGRPHRRRTAPARPAPPEAGPRAARRARPRRSRRRLRRRRPRSDSGGVGLLGRCRRRLRGGAAAAVDRRAAAAAPAGATWLA